MRGLGSLGPHLECFAYVRDFRVYKPGSPSSSVGESDVCASFAAEPKGFLQAVRLCSATSLNSLSHLDLLFYLNMSSQGTSTGRAGNMGEQVSMEE